MQSFYGAKLETGYSMMDYMAVPEDRETALINLDLVLAGEQLIEDIYFR
jgi:hypothetical protein